MRKQERHLSREGESETRSASTRRDRALAPILVLALWAGCAGKGSEPASVPEGRSQPTRKVVTTPTGPAEMKTVGATPAEKPPTPAEAVPAPGSPWQISTLLAPSLENVTILGPNLAAFCKLKSGETSCVGNPMHFIDLTGRKILPEAWLMEGDPKAGFVIISNRESVLAPSKDPALKGFVSLTSGKGIQPSFREIEPLNDTLLLTRSTRTCPEGKKPTYIEGKCTEVGIVNMTTGTVVATGWDQLEPDVAPPWAVRNGAGKSGFVDAEGKPVVPMVYDLTLRCSEDLCPAIKDSVTEYFDRSGKRVLTVQGKGENFSEGLAHLEDGTTGKSAYIDKTGKVVLQGNWDEGAAFSSGLAPVRFGKRFGFIDKTGKLVVKATWWSTMPFEYGLGEAARPATADENGDVLTAWFNAAGQQVFSGVGLSLSHHHGINRFEDPDSKFIAFHDPKSGKVTRVNKSAVMEHVGHGLVLVSVKEFEKQTLYNAEGNTILRPGEWEVSVGKKVVVVNNLSEDKDEAFLLDHSGTKLTSKPYSVLGGWLNESALGVFQRGEIVGIMDENGQEICEVKGTIHSVSPGSGFFVVLSGSSWTVYDDACRDVGLPPARQYLFGPVPGILAVNQAGKWGILQVKKAR